MHAVLHDLHSPPSCGGVQTQIDMHTHTCTQTTPPPPPTHTRTSAGLGKTTLAHVVAAHCGFRVVEINASDERTAARLGQRISDAVHMQAVSADKRPNCVVIDEIDGATGEGWGLTVRALQAMW